jgi:glyoxylase-like metal-dependent hydrolase (beta-lactamase superfamily II)
MLAILAAAAIGAANPAAAQDAPERAITPIAGDLYRFQNAGHYAVLLVTPAGILATDPINAAAATWLKEETQKRFGQPIRYVVYSHDHADHISGGEVLDGEAVIVAHDNAKRAIVGEKRPTAVPEVTFSERLTIELGGKSIELLHVGRNHSDNSVVMHFPAERAVFAVDFIPVKSIAFRDLPDSYLPDWIESLQRVEQLDFDILVPGHGPLGTKADVAAFRGYLSDLYGQVLAAARAGKSLEETKAAVDLSKYKEWNQFQAWSPLNIEGAYARIQLQRRPNP